VEPTEDEYVTAGLLLRDFLTWLERRGDGLILLHKEPDARERYQARIIELFLEDLRSGN
jgi:hypothetical protein